MSEPYRGEASTASTQIFTRIQLDSSTFASPIVVSVAAPDADTFVDGDSVEIEGHTSNTGANGTWKIDKLSPTSFSLLNSIGTGTGTNDGYFTVLSMSPSMTIPDDGDPRDVNSINPAFEVLDDEAAALNRQTGRYRLVGVYSERVNDATPATWTTWAGPTGFNAAAWTAFGGLASNILLGGSSEDFDPPPILQPDDVLSVTLTTTAVISAGTSDAPFALAVELLGAAPGTIKIEGSGQRILTAGNLPLHLRGTYYAVDPGWPELFNISLLVYGNVGTPPTVTLKGDYTLTVHHYRRNIG